MSDAFWLALAGFTVTWLGLILISGRLAEVQADQAERQADRDESRASRAELKAIAESLQSTVKELAFNAETFSADHCAALADLAVQVRRTTEAVEKITATFALAIPSGPVVVDADLVPANDFSMPPKSVFDNPPRKSKHRKHD